MSEPLQVVVSSEKTPESVRLTVGLKSTYPLAAGGEKVFLSPMATLSRDLPEGADLFQEANRMIAELRPVYGLALLQEYTTAADVLSGKRILDVVKGLLETPTKTTTPGSPADG